VLTLLWDVHEPFAGDQVRVNALGGGGVPTVV
jgi:hypothetical protein